MKKVILLVAMLSLVSVFACFAATPESDFKYDLISSADLKALASTFKELDVNEDYIEIKDYTKWDEVVDIPEEIEGCKVIKVKMSLSDRTRKVVVPASVVFFSVQGDRPEIEFKRDNNSPFIWYGTGGTEDPDMKKFKTLPTDKKIIFCCQKITLPSEMASFTWPKNWTCMYYHPDETYGYERGLYDFDSAIAKTRKAWGYVAIPELNVYKLGEIAFEEGVEEIPIRVGKIQKVILPKSLKIVRPVLGQKIINYYDTDSKQTIVIPEGSNIKFESGSIGTECLSISTKKALKAAGYNVD